MEVMGLMLGDFVDEYTVKVVDVFAMPQSGTGVSVEAVDPVFQAKMLDMLKQTGRPEMVVGWYHSHPGFGCWLSGVDINTQQSFEALSDRAVAVVVDPVQSRFLDRRKAPVSNFGFLRDSFGLEKGIFLARAQVLPAFREPPAKKHLGQVEFLALLSGHETFLADSFPVVSDFVPDNRLLLASWVGHVDGSKEIHLPVLLCEVALDRPLVDQRLNKLLCPGGDHVIESIDLRLALLAPRGSRTLNTFQEN